jgi:peptidoglycan/LPS O-acetylase OafA/YrhL
MIHCAAGTMAEKKYGDTEFANALRGIAALLVCLGHLLGNFWYSAGAPTFLHSPAMAARPIPAISVFYFDSWHGFGSGQFAVGLFFVISGFVIPISLVARPASLFLVGRFFRIWPVYAAGLFVSVIAVGGTSAFLGHLYIPSLSHIVAHLLFMRDLFGIPLIDGIVWTLEIEIRFYLVCALIAPWIRAGKLWHIVVLAVVGASVASLVSTKTDSLALLSLTASWQFITLMFVGTVFAFLYRGVIDQQRTILAVLMLLAAFYVQLRCNHPVPDGTFIQPGLQYAREYLCAPAAFAVAFFGRKYLKPFIVFDHLASISYPLYVVHPILGFASLRILIYFGASDTLAIFIALGVVWLVSWVVHKFIERPFHELGHLIMDKGSHLVIWPRSA